MRARPSARTIPVVMSDASLVLAALVGLALTTGAILRDTRYRIGLLRAMRGVTGPS